MDLAEGTQIVSLTGERHAPTLPHLAEGQERKVYYFGLFPNLLLSVHPDYIMTHRLRPLAPRPDPHRVRVAVLPRGSRVGRLRPLLRQRLLGHHQQAGLAGVRRRPAGRLLARLPSGTPLAQGGRCVPVHHHGRQRLPRGQSSASV
jgi:hypothetical protein